MKALKPFKADLLVCVTPTLALRTLFCPVQLWTVCHSRNQTLLPQTGLSGWPLQQSVFYAAETSFSVYRLYKRQDSPLSPLACTRETNEHCLGTFKTG
jgi:hypothetical protein